MPDLAIRLALMITAITARIKNASIGPNGEILYGGTVHCGKGMNHDTIQTINSRATQEDY